MLTRITTAEQELFEEMSKTRYGAALRSLLETEDRLQRDRLVGLLDKDEMLRVQGGCRLLQQILKVVVP
jgi:hypothetical protein